MPKQRPLIGVTGDFVQGPPRQEGTGRSGDKYVIGTSYFTAVIESGGLPILIPCSDDASVLDAYLQRVDGVLFTGWGRDYPPPTVRRADRPADPSAHVAASGTRPDALQSLARLGQAPARHLRRRPVGQRRLWRQPRPTHRELDPAYEPSRARGRLPPRLRSRGHPPGIDPGAGHTDGQLRPPPGDHRSAGGRRTRRIRDGARRHRRSGRTPERREPLRPVRAVASGADKRRRPSAAALQRLYTRMPDGGGNLIP